MPGSVASGTEGIFLSNVHSIFSVICVKAQVTLP